MGKALEKAERQEALLGLLEAERFSSQGEVVNAMQNLGYQVTQPSISRDFHELGIVKVAGRYLVGSTMVVPEYQGSLQDLIQNIQPVGDHLLVVRTRIGAANVVAVAIDKMLIDGLAGTIAGDDTVFLAITDELSKARVLRALKELS